jgi:hypothetical protein
MCAATRPGPAHFHTSGRLGPYRPEDLAKYEEGLQKAGGSSAATAELPVLIAASVWMTSDWQISRFVTAQDAVNVARGLPEQLGDVNNAHHASIIFRPMMPARMSARNVSRRTETLSPSAIMPAIATPNTPMPTHTA